MGILNVTPDSFFDGGAHPGAESAVAAARAMAGAGAWVIDVGGESTRPGAARVAEHEQIARVVPVIAALRAGEVRGPDGSPVLVTVDTTRAAVAEAALAAGADAINDVSAGLDDAGMLELAGRRGCGIVLMHRLTEPARDSYSDRYARPPEYAGGGVVPAVAEFLAERARAALAAGVGAPGIVLDPGLGFGKTVEQNLALIRRTGELARLGYPVLSGLSRKSFTGRAGGLGAGSAPGERLGATIALTLEHARAGAAIFRVHDVGPVVQALVAARRVWGCAELDQGPA